jgi:hypothetical protein
MENRPDVQEAALRFLSDRRKRDALYSLTVESIGGGYKDPLGGTLLHAIAYHGMVTMSLIVLSGMPDIPKRYLSRFGITVKSIV